MCVGNDSVRVTEIDPEKTPDCESDVSGVNVTVGEK